MSLIKKMIRIICSSLSDRWFIINHYSTTTISKKHAVLRTSSLGNMKIKVIIFITIENRGRVSRSRQFKCFNRTLAYWFDYNYLMRLLRLQLASLSREWERLMKSSLRQSRVDFFRRREILMKSGCGGGHHSTELCFKFSCPTIELITGAPNKIFAIYATTQSPRRKEEIWEKERF